MLYYGKERASTPKRMLLKGYFSSFEESLTCGLDR